MPVGVDRESVNNIFIRIVYYHIFIYFILFILYTIQYPNYYLPIYSSPIETGIKINQFCYNFQIYYEPIRLSNTNTTLIHVSNKSYYILCIKRTTSMYKITLGICLRMKLYRHINLSISSRWVPAEVGRRDREPNLFRFLSFRYCFHASTINTEHRTLTFINCFQNSIIQNI